MSKAGWLVSCLVVLAAAGAGAQEVVLFNAVAAGPDAWSWENAKVTKEGAELVIAENNAAGAYGDVFVSEALPYLPDAALDLDVAAVDAGVYTVQVLAFKGQTMLLSTDLAKDSVRTGRFSLPLGTAGLPPFTDRVMIKIWVANAEGAAVRLRNLRYVVPASADRVVLDWAVDGDLRAEPENAAWEVGAAGGNMALGPDQSYGAVVITNAVTKPEDGMLLVQSPVVMSGTLTVQLALFVTPEQYVTSVNAIQRVGAGWHAVDLAALSLPPEAKFWRFKLWLEGKPGAKATVSRFIVLKKAPAPTVSAADAPAEPPQDASAESSEDAPPAEPPATPEEPTGQP